MKGMNIYMDSRPAVLEPVHEVQLVPDNNQDTVTGSPLGSYAVKAYNNETTKFGDVVGVFIISCGYGEQLATRYTVEIHEKGSSVCYWASKERCLAVIADFKKIGVVAELIEEKS